MRKYKIFRLATVIYIFFITLSLHAQLPQVLWDKTIGGDSEDKMSSFFHLNDDGFLLFGTSRSNISGEKSSQPLVMFGADAWIIKFDSQWQKQWDKVIGGYEDDIVNSVIRTADDGFLIGFSSASSKSGDKSENSRGKPYNDYWIVKINAAGNKVWDKTYGGNNDDNLSFIKLLPQGGYLLGGTSLSGATGDKTKDSYGWQDYWIIKIDTAGNMEWDQVYGGEKYDVLSGIFIAYDGYILTGKSNSPVSGNKTDPGNGSDDIWLVKIDYDGNKIWDRCYGGDDNESSPGLIKTGNNGFLISSLSKSGISGDKTTDKIGAGDSWYLKVDTDWNIQWDKTIGTIWIDKLGSPRKTDDGHYLLIGEHVIQEGIPGSLIDKGDRWIMKTDTFMNVVWEYKYGGTNDDNSGPVIVLDDNTEILIGGNSNSNISGQKTENSRGGVDFWITKVKLSEGIQSGYKNFLSENILHVYPNPVETELLFLDAGNDYMIQAEIYNLSGIPVIITGNINNNHTQMDISGLSPGLYFIRVSITGGKIFNQKVIRL
ncbi:MAG: hypothetical protein A2Y71_10025 [Bacteroidetes bacterium RBG_13_42_15]|nr:MAG: hypothetical protein A2Y71_10025 [Bacteroidetes bacterium RBG_13_42_15]